MKTTFRLIGAVATAAALFSSCKKEAFNEDVKPGTVEMTIIAGADDETRTVLGSDGAVTWSASGEQLAVIEAAVSGTTTTTAKETSKVGVTNNEGATMSFGVSMTAKIADSFEYYALYPNSAYVDTPSDFTKVKVNLASTQHPTESSFGPSADVLVAKPVTYQNEQPKELNLQFARVIAVGKMTIKNLNTTENVKKVIFTATEKAVTGSRYIDFTTAAGVEYGDSSYGVDNVVLDYSDKTIAANEMTAHFTCWPFELTAGETFSVVVETESYTFTKEVTLTGVQSLAFKVGRASTFSVDFSRIEGVEKVVPDGAYVVAYDKNMMTVGTTSNAYRGVATLPETANEDGSYLVDATAAWNFVYDLATDTYKIYSASGNTLYLKKGSSNTALDLVGAKESATSFKITKDEVDGSVRIIYDTRCIGYNAKNVSPRFAMYLSTATEQIVDLKLYPAKVFKLAQITVQETLDLSADLAEGEFSVSWKNVNMSRVSVNVYQDADCTIREENWISVEFNADKTAIAYTVLDNDTKTERKAYIKVKAISTDGESEDSKIITVTQAAAGQVKQYTLTITKDNFNTKSYSANNNVKTTSAVAEDGSSMNVTWYSNQVMQSSGTMQWQKKNGYIYNRTDLGEIVSVTVNSTDGSFTTYYGTAQNPTSGTNVSGGYFTTKVGNDATGKTTSVVIKFKK